MIKTLSPYNIYIPLVNPTTLVTCDFYTLKVYVWNGLINSIPATSSYQITKKNPIASTGTDKINISNVINDFINFTQQKGVSTSVIDGNNQSWVQYRVLYSDSVVEELITTVPMVKGYSYGMDGENQSTPANKVLLNGREFKVSREGVFVLPLEADIIQAQLIAENDIANIYFEDTLIDVLNNDALGFTPTSIVEVTTTMLTSVGVLSIEANKVRFTKGTAYTTPQTFDYKITDAIGQTDTATVTMNISDVPTTILAVNDSYALNNVDTVDLLVMGNDFLGTAPTTIISVNTTGFTLGTITIITGTKLSFVPNGTYGSGSFTYTIQDNIAAVSTATVNLSASSIGSRHLVSAVVSSYGGNPNPSALITGTYSDTLEDFAEFSTVSDPFTPNRCVIESSLSSSIPAHTVFNFNDVIIC